LFKSAIAAAILGAIRMQWCQSRLRASLNPVFAELFSMTTISCRMHIGSVQQRRWQIAATCPRHLVQQGIFAVHYFVMEQGHTISVKALIRKR